MQRFNPTTILTIEPIDEKSADSFEQEMKNRSIHLYSHLMKCQYHANNKNSSGEYYISTDWIGTIFESAKKIKKVPPSVFSKVRKNDQNLYGIKNDIIEEYINDDYRNKEAEKVFNEVHGTFNSYDNLININLLKSFLINLSKNLKNEDDILWSINKH